MQMRVLIGMLALLTTAGGRSTSPSEAVAASPSPAATEYRVQLATRALATLPAHCLQVGTLSAEEVALGRRELSWVLHREPAQQPTLDVGELSLPVGGAEPVVLSGRLGGQDGQFGSQSFDVRLGKGERTTTRATTATIHFEPSGGSFRGSLQLSLQLSCSGEGCAQEELSCSVELPFVATAKGAGMLAAVH
jgi:hypothetical protein